MRRVLWLLVGMGFLGSAPAGDLYVVVNARNPVQMLNRSEVIALFTGRLRSFPGDGPARPYDLGATSEARASFYKLLTGMDLARVNSYWSRLQFTGQVQSPRNLPNDNAMTSLLRDDLGAIGYLTQAPRDESLRVVYVVRDSSAGEGQ